MINSGDLNCKYRTQNFKGARLGLIIQGGSTYWAENPR